MRIPTWVQLLLYILSSWGVFELLAAWTSFPALHWLPVGLFGIGIFIFKERPFVKAGLPVAFENSLIFACGLVLLGHVLWVILVPRFEAEKIAQEPCAPSSIEMQCYTFSKNNCSSLWTHFQDECKAEVKQRFAGKATSLLTGPMVKKCTYKKLDRSFRSNRRSPTETLCQEHFSVLDAPSLD
ncbi:MAG: hypothetical protein ACAH59_09935 [Pseudobdellovibrionaceae bacterium]